MSIKVGEKVHVPSSKAGLGSDYPHAMTCGVVNEYKKQHLRINLPNGEISNSIQMGLARKKLGIFIIEIGDFVSEDAVLNPLRKSILQYTRLLLNDDFIRCITIRAKEEFTFYWEKEHSLMSHVVLVGHGSKDSINFGNQNSIMATEFTELLRVSGPIGEAKQIISLCCKTGSGSFGKAVSSGRICEVFMGPSGPIHAANASQFYQSYMAYHLLSGYNTETAYDYARVANPGVAEFNLWRKTKLHNKRSRNDVFGTKR